MSNFVSDRELLRAFSGRPCAETFEPIVSRYLPLVYASAFRRTGDATTAADATRAVFAVFQRRAKRIRKRTVLARWFFDVTRVACGRLPKRRRRWWFCSRTRTLPTDASQEERIAARLDAALEKLPARYRSAVLLALLGWELPRIAVILRIRERRASRRVARAWKTLARRLRRFRTRLSLEQVASAASSPYGSPSAPDSLFQEMLAAAGDAGSLRAPLARRTLTSLAWRRWRRRVGFGVPALLLFLASLIGTAIFIDFRTTGGSNFFAWYIVRSVAHQARSTPGFIQDAKPWIDQSNVAPMAARVRQPADLFIATNIWGAHLEFTAEEWKRIQPRRVDVLPNFLRPDGTVLLRNPKAQRSGLAGVLGYDFDFVHGNLELGGSAFTNIAARFKGNGTYLASLYGPKQSFKVDLNKYVKGQKLADIEEVNFANLIEDRSYMAETLGYELFRDAGVPAPRTAYAWLTISVPGKWSRKPLGLYLLVETVEGTFGAERFGTRKAPIFKPVTYNLFEDLGESWAAYEAIYDLKTKATPEQLQRVIDLCRLVSHASNDEFRARIGSFLDMDEFARFLAVEVLLSHYDSILSNGQNFYMYFDPRSDKFGFIPWDLDHAWGTFPFIGTVGERERASIARPWVGQNRFLERVMAVKEFQDLYHHHLDTFLNTLFVPDRLGARIDALAAVIRGPVGAESSFRAERFEIAVGDSRLAAGVRGNGIHPGRPVVPLKGFIEARAKSVRGQLDGHENGMELQRNGN